MISSTRSYRLAAAAVVAVGAMASAALSSASTAEAATATHPVQFSTDGVTWSDTYDGALFGGVLLVPGGSADRAFYVRNGAADPAILRVTLYDVTTTDTVLAGATSIATSMPGRPGASVLMTDAQPCATLSEGEVLAAGGSVRLDNVAALADLNGTSGQGHSVSFKLAITLSSTDAAAPAPDSCPTDFGTVVGTPEPGTGSTSHPVYHLGSGGWVPTPITPTPTPTPPPTSTPAPRPHQQGLVANTQRLYQEDFVALWLAMATLGSLILFIARRRRRHADATIEHPTTHHQIGIGR